MRLMKLNDNWFRVETDKFAMEGSLEAAIMLLEDRGVNPQCIDFALDEMDNKNHDTAFFGVNMIFTHTETRMTVNHAVLELLAIQAVREELYSILSRDPLAIERHDMYPRLMNLYGTLNVERLLKLLGKDVTIRNVA